MQDEIYPQTIVKDRYQGAYSDSLYTAWNCDPDIVPAEINDEDIPCMAFWSAFTPGTLPNGDGDKLYCGKGKTPNEALIDLARVMAGLT